MKSNYSNKTILVTGGGGYIGTHVTERLLNEGYNVRIFDQFMFGENAISTLKKNKNLTVIKGEIGEWQKLRESLNGVDAVIHLAGLVGDPACIVNKELTIQMNIVSTRIVKELSKDAKVSRFIFSSSCSVYGASDELMSEESKRKLILRMKSSMMILKIFTRLFYGLQQFLGIHKDKDLTWLLIFL